MNRGLLDVVRADPEADEPRLVCADWYDDHGDHDRAEFVRVQLERARLPAWDVRQVGLAVREQRLLAEHGASWRAELPTLPGVRWDRFVRGFVATAEVDTFGALVDASAAVAEVAPLSRVTVPWPETAGEAQRARPIPTLRELRIERALREPDEAAWLADAVLLSTVEALELVDGYSPDPSTERLLASPHLRRLRRLTLVRNEVGRLGIRALIEAGFPDLESLTLSEVGDDGSWSEWTGGLSVEVVQALADWPGLARLRAMDLSGNRIHAPHFEALFGSRHLTGLESLGLGSVLGNPAEIPWESAPPELHLSALDLSSQMLSGEDGEALSRAPCLRELRHLDLSSCTMEEDSLSSLLEGELARGLQVLDLSSLDCDEMGSALRASPLPALHTLHLRSFHRLEDVEIEAVVTSGISETLHALDLSGAEHGDEAAHTLARSEGLGRLEWLRIHGLSPAARSTLRASPLGQRLAATGGLELDPP